MVMDNEDSIAGAQWSRLEKEFRPPVSSGQIARMKLLPLTTIKKGYTFGAARMARVIEQKTAHQAEWIIYSQRHVWAVNVESGCQAFTAD